MKRMLLKINIICPNDTACHSNVYISYEAHAAHFGILSTPYCTTQPFLLT